MKSRCPECGKPWPAELRKAESKLYCTNCVAEKRGRQQARVLHNLDNFEKRALASKARWDAMSPEERAAEAALAKSELWPRA